MNKIPELPAEYKKFRKLVSSSGTLVIAGKDAEQNEEVVKLAEAGEIVMHTKAPGSPFCIIKAKKPSKQDIKETALFCAKFSRDWKTNHKDIEIHVFSGKDIFKEKGMKTGTFGVKKSKSIITKKEETETF